MCSLAFWLILPERADVILPIGSDANIEPLANPENPAVAYAKLAIPILGTILGFIGTSLHLNQVMFLRVEEK
jgi:hypothetical protein